MDAPFDEAVIRSVSEALRVIETGAVIPNVPIAAPGGMVIEAGIVRPEPDGETERAMTPPPAGAGPFSATVHVELAPAKSV